jgi:hypothetical protein
MFEETKNIQGFSGFMNKETIDSTKNGGANPRPLSEYCIWSPARTGDLIAA